VSAWIAKGGNPGTFGVMTAIAVAKFIDVPIFLLLLFVLLYAKAKLIVI
jgi:hypothetical protein